ncbi:MAG TPA: apolipoprotein N-acyltransferase [Candidatus Methylomirabilis sp.]|nr:apolipoprotein N-acyltransferase [Candidatus Methylomirabilis sp.]
MDRLGVIAGRVPLALELPRPVRLGLAVGSGLLCSAAFPSWDIGALAFVGLVPLFLAVEGASSRQAAWLGYVSGLTFYLATIWWVINTMTTYGRMPLALSLVALLLLCGVLAGYTAAFTWLLSLGARRLRLPGGLLPLTAAGLWTALEFLRTYLFSGFPWALLGYSQHRQPTIRLLAAAVGVYGISALLVLVNGALADVMIRWLRPPMEQGRFRGALLSVGVACLALAATLGYARAIWRDPTGGAPIRVGLLQGNIDQSVKWERSYQTKTLDIYERLAQRAAAEHPALIVWPESAVPFFLRYEPELGLRVRRFAVETGIPMLVGSPDVREDQRLYNSAFLLGRDGQIHGRYDKRHLVPFGEYVPLKHLFFFLDKLVVGIGDFGSGRTATVFSLDGIRFGVMICYEAIFPAEVRQFARRGAEFLVNITNDAWFGRSGAPAQHLAMAAMRAVENGSYLVRAANTGITAVIAPTGEILAQTEIFTETALVGTIRPRVEETPYTRYGDVLPWACLVFLGAYLLAVGRARWLQGAVGAASGG